MSTTTTVTTLPGPAGSRRPEPGTPGRLVAVGVTFGGADVDVRRRLALDPARSAAARARLARDRPDLESVVIATCHRTEVVLAGDRLDPATAIAAFHRALGFAGCGLDAPWSDGGPAPCLAAQPGVWVDDGAVEHLFRVACGLDSASLGDSEIIGQLRTAWRAADEAGGAGRRLRRAFRDAFAVGRRARASTAISAGGAGIGSAVAGVVGDRSGPLVLVGAGEAATTIARRLSKQVTSIVVANRRVDRAVALAAEVGGRAVGLDSLPGVLATADVVVAAVDAPVPVVPAAMLAGARARVPDWDPLIVDVGANPAVEPAAGFEVVGLDSLASRADTRDRERAAAVPAVEALIADALVRYRTAERGVELTCGS